MALVTSKEMFAKAYDGGYSVRLGYGLRVFPTLMV